MVEPTEDLYDDEDCTCRPCAAFANEHRTRLERELGIVVNPETFHQDIVAKCKESLFFTGVFLCGFDKLSTGLHKPMADWLQRGLAEGHRRFFILTPRGHLKTTLFNQAYAIWRLINDSEQRLLMVMCSTELAEEKLGVVKRIVFNDQFQHFFPHLIPDRNRVTWTASGMELPRTGNWDVPSYKAAGLDAKKTGGHFTEHIFDDLIDGERNDLTVESNKAQRFLKQSNPLWVSRKTGIRIIIGTLWPCPFYTDLLEDDSYQRLILGARVDSRYREFMSDMGLESNLKNGDPIFPEEETHETLEFALKDMGEFDFAHQILNIIVSEGLRTFRREDMQFYTRRSDSCVIDNVVFPIRSMRRTLTIDPATGENTRTDQSAIVVCGYVPASGMAFVLDEWQGRVLQHELIERTLNMAKRWNVDVIAPEEVSYQATMKYYLRQRMLERGLRFSINPVRPGNVKKGKRLLDALQPFIRNRQVYFHEDHKELIDELCALNIVGGKVIGRSPNLADALAYHPNFWLRTVFDRSPDQDAIEYDEDADLQDVKAMYALRCSSGQMRATL